MTRTEALEKYDDEAMQVLIARASSLFGPTSKTADLFRDIREVILALAAQPVDGWRPIETAPRGGERFVAHIANGQITVGWYISGKFFVADNLGSGETEPTHWMPLPTPPEVKP
jgi:hypothetical protein